MNLTRRNLNSDINSFRSSDYEVVNEKPSCAKEGSQQGNNMRTIFRLRYRRRYIQIFMRIFVIFLFIFYIVVPIAVYLFPSIQSSLIFLSFVRRPWFADFAHPEKMGMETTRNFYIDSSEGIKLGAWHILPKSFMKNSASEAWFESSLKDGPPVVIYLHGNAGSRASQHRIELYKLLRELDAHVIAADYRGYGDSTSIRPTEIGIVNDAKIIYNWVKDRAGTSQIFIWGHSLGTGVASRAVSELNKKGEYPKGLVLEAPFNNMSEEMFEHPLASMFAIAPWFHWAAKSSLKANNALFESDKHIKDVTIPILILHAEDDSVIPVALGTKLYEAALNSRTPSTGPVSFIKFTSEHGYNHKWICRAPNLPTIIRKFMDHPEEKLPSEN